MLNYLIYKTKTLSIVTYDWYNADKAKDTKYPDKSMDSWIVISNQQTSLPRTLPLLHTNMLE